MKKVISVLLALALSLMMIPAFAEGADYTGTWYIQRGVSGEETLEVVDPEGITLELREDGTFAMNTAGITAEGTWTVGEDGVVLTVDGTPTTLRVEGEELVLDSAGAVAYLGRTPATPKELPAPLTVTEVEAFNGTWVPVAQISSGLFAKIDPATSQLGEVVIENGMVKTTADGYETEPAEFTFADGVQSGEDTSIIPTQMSMTLLEDGSLCYRMTVTLGEITMPVILICAPKQAVFGDGEEPTYSEQHPEVLAFDSYWVSGDGQVRIDAHHTDGGYEISVVEMTGKTTFNSWEYLLVWDEEAKALVANGTGMKSACTMDENGNVTESKVEYEDSSAEFFINEDGQLSWSDDKDPSFDATVFNRIGRLPGRYICDRAQLRINWAGEDLIYDVNMDWADSADQSWSWMLSGNYDPATDTLPLNGVRLLYTYKDNGELDLEADQQEAEVNVTLAVDEEGFIVVTETDDPSLEGMRFEPDPDIYGMWMWEF